MNDVIKNFVTHRSDRSYSDKAIPEDILNNIIESAWRAPTSVHSQQISLIVTRDKATKEKLAALCGGQPWIAQAPVFITFVIDLHKSAEAIALAGHEQIAHQSIESIVSGSLDAGIALGTAMAAARSQGLGVVPIGGMRRDPLAVAELLNLPSLTFPVNGLTLGFVDEPAHIKPRLPLATFRHEERYSSEHLVEHIHAHNQQLTEHWHNSGRDGGENWSDTVGSYYRNIYFPAVYPALIKQGFGTDK